MSYSRRFSRRIGVPYHGSVTVSYPASEHGGSRTVSYSGTAYEDVDVDIYVDTDPFDSSINSCNNSVNGLTTSVATMNAAQCLSIEKNTDRISQTIIDGFFKTVRSDLSTQRAELEQTLNARLILLRQQEQSLKEKQQTMERDYARTSARYQKIFDDLNKELAVRIHRVDQPIFDAVRQADTHHDRMLRSDMVQTPLTVAKENITLQAQINTAKIKNDALQAMERAKQFLASKALSEKTIRETTIQGSGEDTYLMPVCYICTESENLSISRSCAVPAPFAANTALEQFLIRTLSSYQFPQPSASEQNQIRSYIQNEIANEIQGTDEHSNRIRALINKMINR